MSLHNLDTILNTTTPTTPTYRIGRTAILPDPTGRPALYWWKGGAHHAFDIAGPLAYRLAHPLLAPTLAVLGLLLPTGAGGRITAAILGGLVGWATVRYVLPHLTVTLHPAGMVPLDTLPTPMVAHLERTRVSRLGRVERERLVADVCSLVGRDTD